MNDRSVYDLFKSTEPLGIKPEDPDYIDWSELYCKMYDETPDSAEYNYDAMLEDILARIVVS